jgi:hypothetical protein
MPAGVAYAGESIVFGAEDDYAPTAAELGLKTGVEAICFSGYRVALLFKSLHLYRCMS